MRWVSAHGKRLLIDEKVDEWPLARRAGVKELLSKRSVHELLFQPTSDGVCPSFPALWAARNASDPSQRFVWIDGTESFYPPAAVRFGFVPQQMYVLRPKPSDLVWATIESLRCPATAAVVALIPRSLSRVEVRRLQLAAESGSSVGILMRPSGRDSSIYAAATRWLVSPMPGERTVQRWRLEFIHGHGWQIGQSFVLEKTRATGQADVVRLPSVLADRPKIAAAS
jgi:hypothetical protein